MVNDSNMAILYPSLGILHDNFAKKHPFNGQSQSSRQEPCLPEPSRFPSKAFSAEETAQSLSAEAQKEVQKASAAARAKTGEIELYSPKYYAACTFGGLIACVGVLFDV